MFSELNSQVAKGQLVLVSTPGTVLAGNLGAASRGSHVFNSLVYHVAANKFYSFDGANVSASLGNLASSSGPVYMSDNGLTPTGGNQLMIVDGNNGYVYNVSPVPVVTITGDGQGATATANVANGIITGITVTGHGSGYTTATVQIFGGGGTGANASAVLSGGTLANITMTSYGSGYIVPPTVSITGGGGSNATATIYTKQIVNQQITGVTITNVGSGYTSAPTVTFTPVLGGSGATAIAVVTPSNISSITVANGGSGYGTPIFSQLSSNGGSNAAATATLGPGSVQAINVNSNTYAGYDATSSPVITLTGGGGIGATAQVVIANGSNMTASATLSGNSVSNVTLVNAGSNYSQAPIVSFYGGNGSGANATVSLSGVVTGVNIINGGNYAYNYPPTVQFVGGGATVAATGTVNMGPVVETGHGMFMPVTSVTISNPGSGYTSAPSVFFVGGIPSIYYAFLGTAVAQGTAVISSVGANFTIANGGSGYTTAPNVLIRNPITNIGVISGGAGYTTTPTANITGVVSGISITSPGGGYSSAPTVSFSGGNGSGAAATAWLSGNSVGNIIISNVGSGYTSAPSVVLSGNATANATISSAIATAVLSTPISYITVTNTGSLYSSPPTVVVTDPTGTGAIVTANVYNGMVVGMTINSGGSNYSNPVVSFTANTGAGWPANGANSVCFLNGSFIVGIGGGSSQFQVSNLYDGMLWSGLNIAAKNTASDPLVSVFNSLGWLFLFGKTTSEVWQNTGVGNPPYAWSSSYDYGLAAQASIAKGDNTVFWLGTQKNNEGGELIGVVKASQGGAQIVSPQWINYQISLMTTVSDAVGYCYTQEGHTFYVITFPTGNATYVFDASMPPEFAWHERSFWTGSLYTTGRHKGQYYAYYSGKHYVTDYSTGNIYYLSSTTYTDNASAIGRLVVSNPMFDAEGLYNLFHHSAQIDAQLGGANGTLNLSWSRDGGTTWTADQGQAITSGDYLSRLRWLSLGCDRSRMYRIASNDAMSLILIGAYIEATKGTS